MKRLALACAVGLAAVGARAEGEFSLGGEVGELLRTARAFRPSVAGRQPSRREPAGERLSIREAPAVDEPEYRRCPAPAVALTSAPDPDLYTYIGFRWVRSDGTTCAPAPSERVTFTQEQATTLSFSADPAGPATGPESSALTLAAPEYRVRRNFYFRTDNDGTRRFYSVDLPQATGRQVPETVDLVFENRGERPLLPWEPAETFRLRYGRTSGALLEPLQVFQDYELQSTAAADGGQLRTVVRARSRGRAKLSATDPEGARLTLESRGGTLLLDVQDRWAAYYRGEILELRVKLWRKVFLFGDKVVAEAVVPLDAAPTTVLDAAGPVLKPFLREELKRGHEYYADWSFRRADSRVSTPDWLARPRTGVVKLR